ncbi:MAG: class I SAM-dependent methyltransferase [Pontiellaceae bacterium]|nr:class I SAM-dependent methyltransferase [Pontiellaceae bacterium]
MSESQIKSKERVNDHGEVFTSTREVNAMLDLVKQETERIESRFLEPACGTGNFLAEILRRKLAVVEQRYRKSQLEYERNAVLAVSSIYGIDIQEDNVQHARERLTGIFIDHYTRLFKDNCKAGCIRSVEYILKRNLLWGDALTLKTVCGKKDPLIFSEWSPVNGSMMKRRDYTLASLIQSYLPGQTEMFAEPDLFSDLGDAAFIPHVKQDFPAVHFLKIGDGYE